MEEKDCRVIDEILSVHGYSATNLIGIMQDVQRKYRYLSEEVMSYIAAKLKISEAKVYAVATFYENFSLEAKGKYLIRMCDGTACHVRKSPAVLETVRKELGLSADRKTTDDKLFTVETVSCLGACGLAPVMTVNDVVHPAMTPDKAKELIKSIREAENE